MHFLHIVAGESFLLTVKTMCSNSLGSCDSVACHLVTLQSLSKTCIYKSFSVEDYYTLT